MKRLAIVVGAALLLATQGCCALVDAALSPPCHERTVVYVEHPRPNPVVIVERPRYRSYCR